MSTNASIQQATDSSSPDQKFYDCEELDDRHEPSRNTASPSPLTAKGTIEVPANDMTDSTALQPDTTAPSSSHGLGTSASGPPTSHLKELPHGICDPNLRSLPASIFYKPDKSSSSRQAQYTSDRPMYWYNKSRRPIIRHLMICDNCGELGHRWMHCLRPCAFCSGQLGTLVMSDDEGPPDSFTDKAKEDCSSVHTAPMCLIFSMIRRMEGGRDWYLSHERVKQYIETQD